MKRSPKTPAPLALRLLATCALIGEAAPFAPATWTSLAVTPLIWFYMGWSLWVQMLLIAAVTWIGVLVSGRAEPYYGHDASAITIDEVAGMLVTFVGVPRGAWGGRALLLLAAGFLLFRILDIVKPFPAGRAQRLPRGTGVMADDLMAGLYANLGLRVLLRFI